MKRILIPLDGTPAAEAVLPAVKRMVEEEALELVLVRVVSEMDSNVTPGTYAQDARDYLANVREWLGASNARAIVEFGDPAKEILAVAEREDPWMIVMATHGRTGWDRFWEGSIAETVLRGARVPVFLLRSHDAEARPIRTILMPVGGGEVALAALPLVQSLALEHGASVLLLRVSEADPESISDALRAEDELRKEQIPVNTIFERGDPATVILDVAQSYGADLIAMATHARAGLGRLVHGSVTERVLRGSHVPLVVL